MMAEGRVSSGINRLNGRMTYKQGAETKSTKEEQRVASGPVGGSPGKRTVPEHTLISLGPFCMMSSVIGKISIECPQRAEMVSEKKKEKDTKW